MTLRICVTQQNSIEWRYDDWHNAECRVLIVVILNVVKLNVVMLIVVAPPPYQNFDQNSFEQGDQIGRFLPIGRLSEALYVF